MPAKKTETPREEVRKEEKKVVAKVAPKKEAAAEVKTEKSAVAVTIKAGSLSVPVLTLDGKSTENLSLPKEVFGAEINKSLLRQALRVYSTNEKAHWGNTKTRGEISMTTAKWYRQKGTGNARHGAKSAPIFVHGGVALGPKFRKTVLDLPKKMKKGALIAALSSKVEEGGIAGLGGLDKASGKTKQFAALAKQLKFGEKTPKTVLIVADQKLENAARAVSNLPGVHFLTVSELNAYEVIRHQGLLMTREAVEKLQNSNSSKMKGGDEK
jgi:large subunit ribosomal protein L4